MSADGGRTMIDNFSLALTHGLMLLAAWRLLSRLDLDDDSAPGDPGGARKPFFPRRRDGA